MSEIRLGIKLIAEERKRQVSVEGYDWIHDDDHGDGSLAVAAAALATHGTNAFKSMQTYEDWGLVDKHKGDRIRQLTIAGALIAAEIDRVHREALSRCPECDEVPTGYTRGVETLDGTKYPGQNAKMEPCGCVVLVSHLPNPFVVGHGSVIPI